MTPTPDKSIPPNPYNGTEDKAPCANSAQTTKTNIMLRQATPESKQKIKIEHEGQEEKGKEEEQNCRDRSRPVRYHEKKTIPNTNKMESQY